MHSSLLHQVCQGRGERGIQFFAHGHELCPVATETFRVDASVHDESPVGTASGFVSQGGACLALGHVVADVDHLHHQQVQQPPGHDAAVPGTGEAECRAGTQTKRNDGERIKNKTKITYVAWLLLFMVKLCVKLPVISLLSLYKIVININETM